MLWYKNVNVFLKHFIKKIPAILVFQLTDVVAINYLVDYTVAINYLDKLVAINFSSINFSQLTTACLCLKFFRLV